MAGRVHHRSGEAGGVEGEARPKTLTAPPIGDGGAGTVEQAEAEPQFQLKPSPTAAQARMEFKKPAKPDAGDDDDPPPIAYTDLNDVMAAVRQLFAEGIRRDRDTAIRDLAAALGYQRVGPRIREYLHGDLMAAVHRGILLNDGGGLQLDCRTIDDYPLDLLRKYLLTAMGGTWWDQPDAIRAAARHLGFRRTGSAIEKAFKSAINSAMRRGEMERDGQRLRKR